MPNRPLSLKFFKTWIAQQQDLSDFFNIGLDKEDPDDKFIGLAARPKVGEQKMLERIETDDDPELVIREFLEKGGTVLGIDGKKIEIEVESGTFYLPRFCVKTKKVG